MAQFIKGSLVAAIWVAFSLSIPAGAAASEKELDRDLLRSNEWGLALSGGGVRSAMFAVGALRALHEQGLMPKFDVISSVSGGGYAAYWLYANHLASTEAKHIGDSVFTNNRFPQAACHLFSLGNFVTNWDYAKIAGSLFGWQNKAIQIYTEGLANTFGPDAFGLELQALAAPIRKGQIPYWIINASVYPQTQQDPLREGAFQLTPVLAGSIKTGYARWAEKNSMPLQQAIAISGAAVGPLLHQQVDVPTQPNGTTRKEKLSDGGHTENLGAFALIRRGTKNIIVIDAELDPYLRFGAYKKLKQQLESFSISLQIDDIDRLLGQPSTSRLRKSVYSGSVTSNVLPHPISIHYVKMSLPETVQTQLAQAVKSVESGRQTRWQIMSELESRKADSRWDCKVLHKDIPENSWLAANLADYSEFIDRHGTRGEARDDLIPAPADRFPHYTTVDQSFYIDQSLAYIGLGYLQTCELGALRLFEQGAKQCSGLR